MNGRILGHDKHRTNRFDDFGACRRKLVGKVAVLRDLKIKKFELSFFFPTHYRIEPRWYRASRNHNPDGLVLNEIEPVRIVMKSNFARTLSNEIEPIRTVPNEIDLRLW